MWPGIGLLVAGLLTCGATSCWLSSRIFVALDEPITLRHGHVVSSEFKINLREAQSIEIVPQHSDLAHSPQCSPDVVLQTEWTLKKNGEVVLRSQDAPYSGGGVLSGWSLWFFNEKPGTYRLDMSELADPSCLNVTKPRLRVEAFGFDWGTYEDEAACIEWLAVTLAGAGLFLMLHSRAESLHAHRKIEPVWEGTTDNQFGNGWSPLAALRARRWAGFTTRPWQRASNFRIPLATRNPANAASMMAMACCLCMTLLVFPTYLLHVMGTTPQGMMVRVLGPRTVVGSELAGETLALWIDARNQWYFNSKPTTPRELPRLLRDGLVRQASQVVYVGADDNLEFNAVARAIDIVQREHARAILITTRDRGDAAGAVPRK
jgi:biopolymer transport protein ExbD